MKRGKYRLLAIFLVMLMLTLPFSFALDFDFEQQKKEANVGEAILVNVQGYEPTVIPSSLIEDGDVPIYAFLTGLTSGRLLGTNANYEPFYGQALIKDVDVSPLDEDTKNAVRGSPKYVRPNQYTLENLGYLIITLKQIEKENDVPASNKNFGLLGGSDITLKMNAEITFENVERLFGLIHQDLILEQFTEENAWKATALDSSSFFSNRGFIRAREINNDNAKFTVYAGSDMVWPYTGAPRPLGDLSLKLGETSDYYRLNEMSGLSTNAFRVKLVDIVNPSEKRAKIKVTINNQNQERIVKVGSKVYPGSKLTISSISSSNINGEIKQSVSIKDYSTYSEETLTRSSKKQETAPTETDICKDNVILLDPSEPVEKWKQKIKESTDVAVYCTAAQTYEEIVKNYYGVADSNGVLYEDQANFRLGQIYEFLNQPSKALEHYKKAIINKNGPFMAEAMYRIETLEKQKDVYSNTLDFYENNQHIRVQLEGVLWQDQNTQPTITILVSGENTKQLTLGKNLFSKDLQEVIEGRTYNYNWEITNLDSSYITVEKKYNGNKPKDYRIITQQIYLRQNKALDKKDVYISEINLKKYAMVSIIPGSGEPLISNSNFTIHIPIEKRLIDFTPSQINKQLNKTQEIIKDLDGIIDKLDKVVVTWRKVCMVTFAYLTIKNSLFSGLARTQARHFALNGVDGKSGWNQFCKLNSGVGKKYSRYDDCILENSESIAITIDASQEAIGKVNDDMEDYKEKNWYQNLNKDFTDLDKYGKYMGEDLQDAQTLRDYRYWQLMKDSNAYSQFGDYNLKKEVDTNMASFNLTQKNKEDAYKKTLQELNKYPEFDSFEEDKKLQVFSDLYSANKLNVKIESNSFSMLDKLNIGTLSRVRTDKQKNINYAYTAEGEKQLKLATVNDYKDFLQKQYDQETDETKKKALEEEIMAVKDKYSKTGLNAALTTNQGQVYKEGDKFYVSQTKAYAIGDLNKNYAKGASAEFYPDGKPYCIPTSQGNFVKVLDFHKDGSPSIIQEWNVGSDGLLCTKDDLLVKHESVLARPEYQSENNRLLNQVSRMGIHNQGESISVDGKNFLVSNSRSQADYSKEQPNCFDTMDPSDCQLLFGVCDPVMCPPSRFNLGGTWQVNDVVQTGLIGSIILGLPNFDLPYEPVPICLTGVLAGLQNVKSVLRGYVECLNTAQVQGKSVGICDKIRSVFICELLWKEGIAILNLKGSVLTWISQTFFGQKRGGGEYATFDSSLQNIADSVSFFTKNYATTAFAAYKSRSFNEVGTTICKQAIFGKFPGIGSFLDEIAQPESPPQYTALLTESPFSEKLQQSRYQIFYHIYAGEDKGATISVWLEDSTKKLPTYYATDRCEGIRADIPKGGISSQTLDCVAPTGYDKVCISINGMLECGFGKVSSDFAIDYLNDLIVEDELDKKINSEEECYPSSTTSSYSLTDEVGLFATGVVRVCSLKNPGSGTDSTKWKVIGDCGKDSTGRSLGNCWLDTTTVSIKDTERLTNVMNALNEQGIEQQKTALGMTGLLNAEQSKTELTRIKQLPKDNTKTKLVAMYSYSSLSKSTTIPLIASESLFKSTELLLSKDILELAKKDPDRVMTSMKAQIIQDFEKIYLEFANKAKDVKTKYSGDGYKQQMASLKEKYQRKLKIALDKISIKITESFKGQSINVDNLIAKDITPLYKKYQEKDLEQATVQASNQKIVDSKCNECSGLTCNIEKCHALGNCYLEKKWYGLNLLASSCNFCTQATSCSGFNDDSTMCNDNACTAALGGCEYKNRECVKKSTQIVESKCSNIVQTATKYIGTGYGGTNLCSPEAAISKTCTTQCGSFVSSVFYYAGQEKKQPTGNGKDICNPTTFPIEDTVSHNKFTDGTLLQPGDIFAATSSARPEEGHAGIYVGKGKVKNPVSGTAGCFSLFIPDAAGEDIFIHSTGPVCYSTFDFLFKKQGRRLITFCRQASCCLPNDPVCGKS